MHWSKNAGKEQKPVRSALARSFFEQLVLRWKRRGFEPEPSIMLGSSVDP